MSENDNMSDAETFEESPNMVPGEVETATGVGAETKGGFQAGKLLFALAMLAFAGGWGYSNQDDFKAALGFQDRVMPGCKTGGSCCAHATAMAENGEAGQCCHEAAMAEAEEGSCCAQSQKSALVEALLKGSEDSEATTEEVEQAEVVIEELPVTTETEAAVEEPAEEVAPVEAAPAA